MVKEINFSDYSNRDVVIKYPKANMELTGNMAVSFIDNNHTLEVLSRQIGANESLDMIHTWYGVRDALMSYKEVSEKLNSYVIVGQQRTSLHQVLLDSTGTKYGVARSMREYLDGVITKALAESEDLVAKLLLGSNVPRHDCPVCDKEMGFLHGIAREEFLRGGGTYEY